MHANDRDPPPGRTLVAGVTMGYGHLRAAAALAETSGCALIEVDRPPHAGIIERAIWRSALSIHTHLSRLSQRPRVGAVFRHAFDEITRIPLDPGAPIAGAASARIMAILIGLGFGRRLARTTAISRPLLVATFYAPALAVDRTGVSPVACLVTDTEAHRVWAPLDPSDSRILYLAPTEEVVRRLESYGVVPHRIRYTGFPLPPDLAEEARARRILERRVQRLSNGRRANPDRATPPPRLTIAIGGAGAQADRVRTLLERLTPLLNRGRLRLALVAGTDGSLARTFAGWIETAGFQGTVDLVHEREFLNYYRRFNQLLADTDVLWTKPSELVFYAALGLPLVLDDPVGHHEWHNLQWIVSSGSGVPRPEPSDVGDWLDRHLARGTFITAAQAGFKNLPRSGADRIADILQSEFTDR